MIRKIGIKRILKFKRSNNLFKNFTQNRCRLKHHFILGIETSCDDTCAAVITPDSILSNIIVSQNHLHDEWGGIVPSLAARGHIDKINEVVDTALEKGGVSIGDITAIAVTRGPGLSLCLKVGLMKAIEMSRMNNIPLVPVNHMEGHALIPRFKNPEIKFPFLTVLISGGHTQFLVCRGVGDYVLLGETLDIALGDVYDKVSRMLKLSSGVGGGKEVEWMAKKGDPFKFTITQPMKKIKNCDVSFSGIETAVSLIIKNNGGDAFLESEKNVSDLAATFQDVCVKHLMDRLLRAIKWCEANEPDVKQLIISGGVAANKYITSSLKTLASTHHLDTIVPPNELVCDNAVMIAWAGYENLRLGKNILENPDLDLRFHPKWPLDQNQKNYFPDAH